MSRKESKIIIQGVTVSCGNPPGAPFELFFPFLDREGRPGIDGLRRYAPFLLGFWVPEAGMAFYLPRWESLN